MGDLKTLSVLSYDPEEKVYNFYELNSIGRNSTAKGIVDGDTWTFNGESKMGNKLIKSRFTIKMPSPDSAVMRSEISVEGGPMTLFMELKGTRLKQSLTDSNSCVPHGSEGWPFELFECYRTLWSSHSTNRKTEISKKRNVMQQNRLPEKRCHKDFATSAFIRTQATTAGLPTIRASNSGEQAGRGATRSGTHTWLN